jgi:phage terminase large subunit-like protein
LPRNWRTWPVTDRLRLLGRLEGDRWRRGANPGQTPPSGRWRRVWFVQGARGSGKTRTGAETLAELVLTNPPGDWAVVGPTYGDARDTMVEHRRSGLLKVLGPAVRLWNRSLGELHVANGSTIFADGANEGGERIQGKELKGAWCDEVGLWRGVKLGKQGEPTGGVKAWIESIEFAVREAPALIIATGTPKGRKGVVAILLEEPAGRVCFTHPTLEANRANLEPAVVEDWERRWGGTRLGLQELGGVILEDVAGALWTLDLIERNRVEADPERIERRVVVAIDPAGSVEGDETGIVAASTDHTGEGYVLADRSGNYTPTGWATAAIELYRELGADRIVGERNFGGDMVESVLRQVDPNVPYKSVWASRGKQVRAEPVAALYEKGRVHHVGAFAELESELTTYVPGTGEASPNRLDALVWSFTDLLIDAAVRPVVISQPGTGITSDLLDREL